MTTKEMVKRVRTLLHDKQLGDYITGSTTAIGTTTTFIAAGLSAIADDYLNEKEIVFTSGALTGLRRVIADWVQSTFTGTFVDALQFVTDIGITFEIGDAGFWSDHDIINWLNDGAYQIVLQLQNEGMWDYLKKATTNGTMVVSETYGRAPLPTDCFKAPMSAYINGKAAKILDPGQKTMFDRSSYIGASLILEGRETSAAVINMLYKPYEDAAITWLYAPKPTAFTAAIQTTLPERLHPLIVDWAVKRAWEAKERGDLAGIAEKNFLAAIAAANAESAGAFSGAR